MKHRYVTRESSAPRVTSRMSGRFINCGGKRRMLFLAHRRPWSLIQVLLLQWGEPPSSEDGCTLADQEIILFIRDSVLLPQPASPCMDLPAHVLPPMDLSFCKDSNPLRLYAQSLEKEEPDKRERRWHIKDRGWIFLNFN